jgi:hypothetical protein
LDTRLIVIGGAGLAGLVAGGALWALSGGHAQGEALEAVDARLSRISTRARGRPDRPSDALAQSLALPLFATPSQPTDSQTDVAVQVFGLARSPVRTAALLGISGAPAEWLSVGETRNGVTLRSVSGSSATIATAMGERELMIGVATQGATAAAGLASGGPPAGFKSPPPPASAPEMPQ